MTSGWHDPLSPIPATAAAAVVVADEKAGEHLRNAEQLLLELLDHPAVDKLPPMVLHNAIAHALRRIELARLAIERGVR